MPPRGNYLAHEVGRLAGVSGDRIGQWARRGYIQSSQSTGRPRVYSFQDVAEAMMVHDLIERGLDLRLIRSMIQQLRNRYGAWPLASAPLYAEYGSDDRFQAVVLQEGATLYDVRRLSEPLLDRMGPVLVRITEQLRRGGWAARQVPELRYIEVDPDRLSGRPAIKGRRIAAEFVGQLATRPGGVDILKEDYELSDEEIADARRWWETVQRYELAA
jgi:DNA-binding transcriptional MerR regulator